MATLGTEEISCCCKEVAIGFFVLRDKKKWPLAEVQLYKYNNNYRNLFIFSLKDLESLLQRNKSLVEESENLTESLAKQREKYEQLQVSYSDHNILHTVNFDSSNYNN